MGNIYAKFDQNTLNGLISIVFTRFLPFADCDLDLRHLTFDKITLKNLIYSVHKVISTFVYSKARILRTRIIRIHAYSEVISIPRQKPFKMIRKNEGYNKHCYNEHCYSEWIGCLTSQLTIFQSYMWRHIAVQADRRRSWTYGRAPNAIDISQGSLTCPSKHRHGTNLFIRWFRHTAPFSRLLRSRWGYGGAHSLLHPPGPHGGTLL